MTAGWGESLRIEAVNATSSLLSFLIPASAAIPAAS
jgi:hypothetical protein